MKKKGTIKLEGIRVYADTLQEVKEYVSKTSPRMSIIRFFDEAAKEKLNQIKNEQTPNLSTERESDSKAAE